ncbi:MAG: lytic transglycosylase domain-containing protein [Bdellovibrionales bacterium]
MSMAGIGKFLNNISELPAGQQRTVKAIQQASAKTGVDFAYLVQKANIESSMNPAAKAATSSASGLYQFTKGTWLDVIDRHGAQYGLASAADKITRTADGRAVVNDAAARNQILALRNNPQVAAVMAAELAVENASTLQAKVGGKIGATEMYMAHFLGAGGASALLDKMKVAPNAPAARLLPEAAAANHNVFYTAGGRARSVSEVYNNFAAKFQDAETNIAAAPAKPAVDVASVKVEKVKPVRVAAAKPLQVLATITSETFVANAEKPLFMGAKPVRVAGLAMPGGLDYLMGENAQVNAMMVAEKMLDAAEAAKSRKSDDRRTVV